MMHPLQPTLDSQQISREHKAKISRILTFSCVDGPGNRMVLFFQGCNFNCTSCHNPHSISHCNHCGICVDVCGDNALEINSRREVVWHAERCTQCDKCIDICSYNSSPKVREYSLEQLIQLIEEHHLFLEGITVSGGEATLQLPFIIALFKAIKSHPKLNHLTCFIDSNGSLSETGWQRVSPYLDGAMIDLKAWDDFTHERLVGRGNHAVLRSIKWLNESKQLHEIRLLTIPNQTDYLHQILALSDFILSLNKEVKIRLNAFSHHGVKLDAKLWDKASQQDINRLKTALESRVTNPIVTPSVHW